MKTKVVIICGPTASGKTALAVRLAGNQPTSIISADSRQAYKGLDILTGKDIPINSKKIISSLIYKSSPVPYFEKNNLRFWGYDLLDSDEQYNAADFVDVTSRIIASEKSDGRLVFIVGGTGFYLKALTNPGHLSAVPPVESLRQELEKLPLEKLQVLLREENPVRFNSLNVSDVKNPRRLIRAIEVSRHPSSSNQDSKTENEYVWVGLRLPTNIQEEKIKERIDSRLKLGAIDEVARLLKSTPNQTLPIYTALGVGPIKDYLEGKVTPDELKTLWLTDEMNYSKRQLTWFKKQDQIIWYDQDEAAKLTLPILYENQ